MVDFAPAGRGEGGKLYQGSVWVDRQLYARLRTRAVQTGLEGEVISNEETMEYTPIDAMGQPAPWSAESFILPLRLVAQQILSVVNATTVVERETLLTDVRINGPDFEERARSAESDLTMVRDTEQGLRYLVKDESPASGWSRRASTPASSSCPAASSMTTPSTSRSPWAASTTSPSTSGGRAAAQRLLRRRPADRQLAEPRLFGSKFDFGGDLFALAFPFADTVLPNDDEMQEEEVEKRPASFGLKLGRPLGNFITRLEYDALSPHYGDTDDTADTFVLPGDNLTHSVELAAVLALRLALRPAGS